MDTTKDSFVLDAAPGTDIWRKPPTTDIWNAPISRASSGFLKKFQSARVTFWADWTELYDQGGLLLVLKPSTPGQPNKWIKTGVEFYNNKPQLSTVGCDRWADWSVSPLSTPVDPARGLTLELAREGDEHGKSVWIYQLLVDEATGEVREKIPLREICWIFADENDKDGEEWVLDVSPLIARPAKTAKESLKVEFKEFKVQWLA